jgi:hypothetical protein
MPSSLLRFAYKPFKNRRLGDFLPCKLRKEPDNRGFYGFSKGKSHKNLQVQQAPSKLPLTYNYVKLQRRVITPVYLYGVSALTPKSTVTNALWDTGATISAITPRIQQELELVQIDTKYVRGVTGTKKSPLSF